MALLVTFAVLTLHQLTDTTGALERRSYDDGSTSGGRQPSDRIAVAASDTVKVTGLGIAQSADSGKTKTGLVPGTPSFMSTEQIEGKKLDGRSDLSSPGVMLLQMLTGVRLFRADSMAEPMYKIASQAAPDPRILRPEIPERPANVVGLALSKHLWTRYRDGEPFAADLRLALQPHAEAASRPGGAPGYDAPGAAPVRPSAAFEKTDVMSRPARRDGPDAGAKTDLEARPSKL